MEKTSAKQLSPLLVTAAVIILDGKVLITRRPQGKPFAGYWEFPGGKVEAGEPPTLALQREMLEELGVNVEVEQIIDALYHNYDWGAVLILAYRCRITTGRLRNLEVSEHRWVPLEDLALFRLLPADTPLIQKIHSLS
jgi:8-oxo-dGTP diphosphatase